MIDPFGLVSPVRSYAHTQSGVTLVGLIGEYRPDLALVDSPRQADWLEQASDYTVVKAFPWIAPMSILLVRRPDVLKDPDELQELRAQAVPAIELGALRWQRALLAHPR